MSDHDAAPDPMDEAYVRAEAVLDDEAARAVRRDRVLAAVAREPSAPLAASSATIRRPAWRSGRWLAAAGVAGLVALVATQIYEPPWRQPPVAPSGLAAPPTAAPASVALRSPPGPAVSEAPVSPVVAPHLATPAPVDELAPPAPPPPPPAVATAAAPKAFPAMAQPPQPPSSDDVTVAAERRQSDEAVVAQSAARGDMQKVPVPISAFAGQSRAVEPGTESLAGMPPDRAARLRAAAAAGRTAEVKALLAEGASVDAPDAGGETALMKSIQADQPASAALLRRHGASLDRTDEAGESARDMAKAKGDAALNKAIGVGP